MRVLLATDGSKDAQAATAFLKELPLPPLSEVRIAAVVPLPSFVLDVPRVREFKRSALEAVRGIVENARASLAPRGFGIETDVAVGDPKEEIVGIYMTQAPSPIRAYYRKLFKQLVYQAIAD